jgi:hypothetical protein
MTSSTAPFRRSIQQPFVTLHKNKKSGQLAAPNAVQSCEPSGSAQRPVQIKLALLAPAVWN